MSKTKKIRVKVFRFDPRKDKSPRYDTYTVPVEEGTSVLNVLNYIYENVDSGLSYYYSCRIGVGACCLLKVNGKVAKACTAIVKNDVTIEPLTTGFKVVKDLVTTAVGVKKKKLASVL